MYQRIGKGDFKWIKDIPESGSEIKDFLLDSGSLFFDTTILHENRFYFIHIIDLDGKNDEYLLPAAVRYGGQPEDNHLDIFEAKFRKIWGLPWAFIDVLDGHVYSTWTGNLEIIKIDRTNRQWMTFGKKTNNYHPLQLEETAIASGQSAKQIWDQKGKERTKYSWVGGLFADRELIGLMYLTFDRKTSNWITYLQLYDPNGVFQNEYQLPDVISINAHIQ